MYTLYGIKNCDTMKKAMKHLESKGVEFELFDYKKQTPTMNDLKRWKGYLGEWPVNKKGTTFRKFKDDFESATDAQKGKLLLENLSAIKRPVLEDGKKVVGVGYDRDLYDGL